jgi:P27 family predicted phage terminase small subunit
MTSRTFALPVRAAIPGGARPSAERPRSGERAGEPRGTAKTRASRAITAIMGLRAPPRDQPAKKSGRCRAVTSAKPRAPRGLSARARGFWSAVRLLYRLEDSDFALLEAACRQLDRADEARKAIEEHGVMVRDRFGQLKPSPAVEVERQAHLAFARLSRELGLGADVADSRIPRARDYRD